MRNAEVQLESVRRFADGTLTPPPSYSTLTPPPSYPTPHPPCYPIENLTKELPVFEHLLRQYEPSPQEVLEVLELHQLSLEFQQEQEHRAMLEAYYEAHFRLSQQHQAEHAAMQNEPNFFALFWKKPPNQGK